MSEEFKERGRVPIVWHALKDGHGWESVCGRGYESGDRDNGVTNDTKRINCPKCLKLMKKNDTAGA